MQRKLSLNLSIPTPCSENWENMTPNERGRHCASCDKTVIDFSLYTDKQLVEFFNKTTNKVCGRLSNWQLERQVVYAEPQNHFLYKLLFGSVLTIGLAGSANANYNPNQRPLLELYNYNTNKEKQKSAGDSVSHLIIKIIDDSSKQALPFVSVIVTKNGEQLGQGNTDIDGNLDIYPLDPGIYDVLAVNIGYHDYKMTSVKINKSNTRININMKSMAELILHTVGMMIYQPLPDPTKQTIRKGDTPFR